PHAEGRERGEGVAADIGADMRWSDLALHQLECAEDRPFRTAGAEGGRTLRQLADRRCCVVLESEQSVDLRRYRRRIDPPGRSLAQEGAEPCKHRFGVVFAGRRQTALAEDARVAAG